MTEASEIKADKCPECDGLGYVIKYHDPYNCGDVSSPEQVPCEECGATPDDNKSHRNSAPIATNAPSI